MDYLQRENISPLPVDDFTERLNNVCGAFRVEHADRAPVIGGGVTTATSSGLDFAFVTQNANRIRRSKRCLKQDPGNHYFLIVQDLGHAVMEQAGAEVTLAPGDMFIADSARTSTFSYGGEMSHQISLHLPRDEMRHRFKSRIEGGIMIAQKDPLGRAMRALLSGILQEQADSGQAHITESFYSVFGAFLLNRSLGQDSKPSPDALLLERARDAIAQNLHDADFTVQHLADLSGVSLRHLQRAFRERGEAPRTALQTMRVEAAETMLNKRAGALDGHVSQIAYACGFNDLTTFYRQYRARYGESPKHRHSARRVLQ